MRKIHGLPETVIFPEEEVSTSIGTPYSMSFGITASVRPELQAPIITGTLSLPISFSGGGHCLGGVGLVVFHNQLDFLAEHAARSIDRILGDFRALRHVVAGSGESAGQRLRHADLDDILGMGAAGKNSSRSGKNSNNGANHRGLPV